MAVVERKKEAKKDREQRALGLGMLGLGPEVQ